MGRTLFLEERLQAYIDDQHTSGKWTLGLIIGQQCLNGRDYGIHLMRTPLTEGIPSEEGKDDKKKTVVVTLDSLEDFMVTTHAKQVHRMLPGGLTIVGVFVVASANALQQGQMKLKQLLYAVERSMNKVRIAVEEAEGGDEESVTERFVLQACMTTRKLTCRTFDVADSKSGGRPAECKFQPSMDRWHQLSARFSVDYAFPIPVASTSMALEKQMQQGLQPLCRSLQNAAITVDGSLRPDTEPLDPTSMQQAAGGKRGRKQKMGLQQIQSLHEVQLFMEMPPCNNNSGEPQVTDCGAKMLFRGTIEGRAYVHQKASVGDAARAIKEDIINSLRSRCQLLCEDLLQAEEEQDPEVLYEMPIRVFAPLPDSFVCLCDYMFQDESANDSMERFHELVDLSVTEEGLEMLCERIPHEEELGKPKCRSRHGSGEDPASEVQSKVGQYIGAAIGGLVAALAAGISFMYLQE